MSLGLGTQRMRGLGKQLVIGIWPYSCAFWSYRNYGIKTYDLLTKSAEPLTVTVCKLSVSPVGRGCSLLSPKALK